MTAHLDSLVRELADAVRGDSDDLPVRVRKGVVFAQSPLTVKIGGSDVAVPVQATGPIPVNGTVVWVLESGPRRIMLDTDRGPYARPIATDTAVAALRSQVGGFVHRNSQFRWRSGRLWWQGRLISISHGRGPHWAPGIGWYGFKMPLPNSGVLIPGFGGHGGFSIDGAEGIPIATHTALYGVPNLNGGGEDTSLALVDYNGDFTVPPHWVLIAVASESDGRIMTGSGMLLDEWRDVAFVNGWSNYGQGYAPAQYRKDSGGRVHLRGLVKHASSPATVMFNLPAGYRPDSLDIHTGWASNAVARIDVQTNGDVNVAQYDTGAGSGYLSLASISFQAAL